MAKKVSGPNRISILGLGLIGSSVARAAREARQAHITAMDMDAATLAQAQQLGLADHYTQDAAEAVREADLVVLAVPVAALADVAGVIAPHLKKGAIITDVASVKRIMLGLFTDGVAVVPAHPIAGSEKAGVAAGSASLFMGKPVILTPENPEAPEVKTVAEFWRALGAKVQFMPAGLHDRIYGCVSHMPQYLSFIINELYKMFHVKHDDKFFRLCDSPLPMWEGIFHANADNLAKDLDAYLEVLRRIRSELREGEGQPQDAPDAALVYGTLFPRIAAGCMVHVAAMAERELGIPLKPYAGAGFADFTAPAAAEPEEHLARISAHAVAVAKVADDFAALLARRRYI